ncbi:hydrolase [Clostridia bacterium]|nr:hydrolase [Clostridia bacterium]
MLQAKTKNPAKLTGRQKRQINAAITAAKGDGKPHSVQASIPYLAMYPDGVCHATDKVFSRTIAFEDINYMLAGKDEQTAIFETLCDFYNYFDSSIAVQETFISRKAAKEEFQRSVDIPLTGDEFDPIRGEYSGILKTQLEKGNNGLVRTKYLTFSIEADNLKTARARLARIETDILNHFKVMGAAARPLSGRERLAALHSVLHLGTAERFSFEWDWLSKTGLSTKDYIAPTSFHFGEGRTFRMGAKIGAASFLQIMAPELNDRILADFLEVDADTVVNLHIRSIDQAEAVKMIKRKITDIDGMRINEQKKAVRSGYDMEIMPSDLNTYGSEAQKLLKDLQNRNERMFLLTVIILNVGNAKQSLENRVFQMSGIAQKHNCVLARLDYMQEAGLMSSLPLGVNQIPIQRGLTTSGAAVFIPFVTREIFQSGEALYYGRNALSGNMIMADRKRLKNPNGLILGTPGSGKSFAAKREITNAFLITQDDIIIADPEAEYAPLVEALHGQVIKISQNSTDFVNPMDINVNYSEDESPLALKSDFILSLCELIVGGKNGLEPVEKTVIDRAVRNVYRDFLADAAAGGGEPDPAKMPILENLYDELMKMPETEARRVATALEIYVHGSLNVFNHRTNVDIQNRLVCFDIKQLGKQLKKLGMLIIQDQTWNRVTVNRAAKKSTRYYMDEFHLLFKEPQTAAYSGEIYKRFRKWGGIPTGITQNVKELLESVEVQNILENSDFVLMLNQAAGDREILAKQLNISPKQMAYVTHSEAGEGLIFFGSVILPFVDKFPENTMLYKIMSTRPQESAV